MSEQKQDHQEYETARVQCPACSRELDRATRVLGTGGGPKAGDVTICIACADFLVFADDAGSLRLPTAEELEIFENDDKLTALKVSLTLFLVEEKLKGRPKRK